MASENLECNRVTTKWSRAACVSPATPHDPQPARAVGDDISVHLTLGIKCAGDGGGGGDANAQRRRLADDATMRVELRPSCVGSCDEAGCDYRAATDTAAAAARAVMGTAATAAAAMVAAVMGCTAACDDYYGCNDAGCDDSCGEGCTDDSCLIPDTDEDNRRYCDHDEDCDYDEDCNHDESCDDYNCTAVQHWQLRHELVRRRRVLRPLVVMRGSAVTAISRATAATVSCAEDPIALMMRRRRAVRLRRELRLHARYVRLADTDRHPGVSATATRVSTMHARTSLCTSAPRAAMKLSSRIRPSAPL